MDGTMRTYMVTRADQHEGAMVSSETTEVVSGRGAVKSSSRWEP